MKNDFLLIDLLYRQTFDKKSRDPELRAKLSEARRFVMTDEMTGFLVELVFESFQGRVIKYGPRAGRRICQLLDDIRHFSRLPHRITWVEYSDLAKLKRFKALEDRTNMQCWSFHIDLDQMIKSYSLSKHGSPRIGWLLQQHDQIETSFRCTIFYGHPDAGCYTLSEFDAVWDTENGFTAWPIDPASHSSEKISSTTGWVRQGVGECISEFSRYVFVGNRGKHHSDIRHVWTFLSTVNKIPFGSERLVEPDRGFVAVGAYRRFLNHKILTLNVPNRTDTRKLALRVLGDIIRRRAHQVRGHWRDDWHLPRGNKAIWVGEHQRGDASLGFVVHDYSVHHGEPS